MYILVFKRIFYQVVECTAQDKSFSTSSIYWNKTLPWAIKFGSSLQSGHEQIESFTQFIGMQAVLVLHMKESAPTVCPKNVQYILSEIIKFLIIHIFLSYKKIEVKLTRHYKRFAKNITTISKDQSEKKLSQNLQTRFGHLVMFCICEIGVQTPSQLILEPFIFDRET